MVLVVILHKKNSFAPWVLRVGKRNSAWLFFMAMCKTKSELVSGTKKKKKGQHWVFAHLSWRITTPIFVSRLSFLFLFSFLRPVLSFFSRYHEEQPCQIVFPNSQKPYGAKFRSRHVSPVAGTSSGVKSIFFFIPRMVTRSMVVWYAQVHYLRDPAVDEIIVMDHGKIVARGR